MEENQNTESQTDEKLNEEAESQDSDAQNSVKEEATEAEEKADNASNAENADETESEPKEITPEEKIKQLEAENADLKDQLLRRAADFDNYRKRMLKEKQDAFDYGNAALLGDLLDSLDNFDRTVDAAKDTTDVKSMADGIKMINKNLVSMLESKYNLSSYGKKGDEFDPELHEAIGMQPGEVEKEELGEVYLKGYKLKDKVIRHAKVMVIKPGE